MFPWLKHIWCWCWGRLKAQESLRLESRENEVHLNVVGYCVVVVTHILLSCVFLLFSLSDTNNVGDSVQRQAQYLAKCEALSYTGCELVTGQSYDKRVLNHYSTLDGVDFAP